MSTKFIEDLLGHRWKAEGAIWGQKWLMCMKWASYPTKIWRDANTSRQLCWLRPSLPLSKWTRSCGSFGHTLQAWIVADGTTSSASLKRLGQIRLPSCLIGLPILQTVTIMIITANNNFSWQKQQDSLGPALFDFFLSLFQKCDQDFEINIWSPTQQSE